MWECDANPAVADKKNTAVYKMHGVGDPAADVGTNANDSVGFVQGRYKYPPHVRKLYQTSQNPGPKQFYDVSSRLTQPIPPVYGVGASYSRESTVTPEIRITRSVSSVRGGNRNSSRPGSRLIPLSRSLDSLTSTLLETGPPRRHGRGHRGASAAGVSCDTRLTPSFEGSLQRPHTQQIRGQRRTRTASSALQIALHDVHQLLEEPEAALSFVHSIRNTLKPEDNDSPLCKNSAFNNSCDHTSSGESEAVISVRFGKTTSLPSIKTPGALQHSRAQTNSTRSGHNTPEMLLDLMLQREAERESRQKLRSSNASTSDPSATTTLPHVPSAFGREWRDLLSRGNGDGKEFLNGDSPRETGASGMGYRTPGAFFGAPPATVPRVVELPDVDPHKSGLDIYKLMLHPRLVVGVFRPTHAGQGIPSDLRRTLTQRQLAIALRIGGGFVILADGSLLLENGKRFSSDGTAMPTDTIDLSDNAPAITDGICENLLPDGSKMLADSTRVLADGTRILPDGTRVLPDGTRILADGTRVLADGTRVLADGTRVLPGECGTG